MLEIENLTKDYPTARGPLSILSNVSLSLSAGDAVSIVGPSGSGKSALLSHSWSARTAYLGTVKLEGQSHLFT